MGKELSLIFWEVKHVSAGSGSSCPSMGGKINYLGRGAEGDQCFPQRLCNAQADLGSLVQSIPGIFFSAAEKEAGAENLLTDKERTGGILCSPGSKNPFREI